MPSLGWLDGIDSNTSLGVGYKGEGGANTAVGGENGKRATKRRREGV